MYPGLWTTCATPPVGARRTAVWRSCATCWTPSTRTSPSTWTPTMPSWRSGSRTAEIRSTNIATKACTMHMYTECIYAIWLIRTRFIYIYLFLYDVLVNTCIFIPVWIVCIILQLYYSINIKYLIFQTVDMFLLCHNFGRLILFLLLIIIYFLLFLQIYTSIFHFFVVGVVWLHKPVCTPPYEGQ